MPPLLPRAFLAALGLLPLALVSPVRMGARQGEPPAAARIVFRTSPAIDLYSLARHAAEAGHELPLESLVPAVEAVRALDRALGGVPLGFGPIEGLLPGCKSAADIQAAFARAPETLTLRGGTKVELQKGALALAGALVEAERDFGPLWSSHSAAIDAARGRWIERVEPHAEELLRFHMKSLDMEDPGLELPVYLVGQGPWPGAWTVRDDDDHGVSFVAVAGFDAPEKHSLFFETVLHEVTHSLDLVSERSAFAELRARLQTAGLDPRDRRLHDLPHALMFVQAAESVRRVLDPAHRDYGESEGVYARLGPWTEVLRGVWGDHLDGKLSREKALEELVSSLESGGK